MPCGITTINKAACGTRRRVAGVKQRHYFGTKSEVTSFTKDVNGNVTDINFAVGATVKLKKVYGKKRPAGGNQELQSGANRYFNQSYGLEFEEDSDTIITSLHNLLDNDDVFVIAEQIGGKFKLFGEEDGLEVTTLTKADGGDGDASQNYVVELTGMEADLAPFVLDTDYATTLAALEAHVTA
jgi:hypothetical protein